MNFFDRFKKEHIIIAHRGYSYKYPENTKIALENALKYADMIEVDITITKDKKIVLIHDDTLFRTSNAKDIFQNRDSYLVSDFYYSELLELDFSSWFDKKLPTQKIILLEELLGFSRQNKIALNIEIKDMSVMFVEDIFIEEIYDILKSFKMTNEILFSSFNHNYLKKIKRLDKNISTAALFDEQEPKDLLEYLKSLEVDAYHIDLSLVNEEKIKLLKRENIFTNVHTINDEKIKNELFELGVKGIFSDKIFF